MDADRRSGSRDGKAAELSTVSPVKSSTLSTTAAVTAVAKLQRVVHSLGSSSLTASRTSNIVPEVDAQALIKSFRRKKYVRARLLLPLQSEEPQRAPPPRRTSSSPRRVYSPRAPLDLDKQSLLDRLPEHDPQQTANNREEDIAQDEIETLQHVHALLASPDEIDRWIATYETEKAQFASFALFTEMKLDEIHDKYVSLAGRPNAVEAAACCAMLLKMPGLVGCYRTLLEKIAIGVLSVVYLPDETQSTALAEEQPMATLVRGFFARKPYFQKMQELEMQLRQAKSLTDPNVLRSLTVNDIQTIVTQIPVRTMSEGIVNAYAMHLPNLDHLLASVHEKKLQLQLEFYQLHGRRRRMFKRRSTGEATNNGDDDDDDDFDDPDYPITVPLTSSAQICRAITHHAASFSSSGKEMILRSILEHIDVDSFRDAFKRFDAHGKTCFLHHLSVLESSDHLQLILEQLPNPGDMLFRFYYVICGGGGSGRQEEGGGANPKHIFFKKILGAEMEFFFLCDLAAYLNDEQWTLLSQEYEKHAQERKARRKRLRQRRGTGADGEGGGEGDEDEENAEDDVEDFSGDVEPHQKKANRSGSTGSLEQFQLMVWNYIHKHKFTSAQLWAFAQAVLLPSLEEAEINACIDHCMDRLTISNRWKKLLGLVDEMEADGGTASADGADAEHELARHIRLKILKRLFAMLSREERAAWMDKTTAKYGVLTNKPPPPAKKEVAPITIVQAAPTKPPNLEDPKPFISLMRLDLKILWLEALLNAVTSDKETSARTAMLKQVLVPFINGQTPVVPAAPAAPAVQEPKKPEIESLSDAERAIRSIVSQLKAKNPADEVKLWKSIVPESMRPRTVETATRAVSPLPQLIETKEPVKSTPSKTQWWEVSGPNSAVAKAFRSLVESKSENDVLEILRCGLEPPPKIDRDDGDSDSEPKIGAASFKNSVKRKVSAIVAVAEPMEWHERVKVGMLDEATQTELPETPHVDSSLEKPTVVVARAPLTLTALLGRGLVDKPAAGSPRRKNEAKYQKLNSSAVPRSIAGLITSWRVNTDQLIQFAKKSMPTVLRLIADAYGELLTAGRRKANFQAVTASGGTVTGHRGTVKELTLAQIVYQQFLHSYGLPGIADMHLLAFSCALEAYRSQHLRVEFFSRFVFEEVSKLELSNFLEFLECLVCEDVAASANSSGNSSASSSNAAPGPVTTKRQRFVPRVIVSDKENWMVPLEKAQEAAQLCFRAMRKQAVAAFCEKLAMLAAQGSSSFIPGGSTAVASQSTVQTTTATATDTGRSSPTPYALAAPTTGPGVGDGPMLNVDHLLQLVVEEWREEQLRREGHLLNVFRAGDVNGDGELTSAEFTQIVLAIDHTRELDDILLMYSETLRRTECDAIDAESFLQVAKEYELDRAAWNEDGDLRNVVNDMSELQETWQHTRAFFLGTLEALARDLPTVHFLRVCEGAGCGCLKCILDGYIGFQRMRRDYFTTANPRVAGARPRGAAVSEALLWARFWHLMRQLYEAASESPGVLTAWEGAAYMRVEPAPRPPPRFLKFRRLAVPNFLFPDTTRISGKMSAQHVEPPEVFDRDGILAQFANLMALMTISSAASKPSSDGS